MFSFTTAAGAHTKKIYFAAFLFWILASTLAYWLYPVQIPDVCNRYAPMADAFARGDFAMAYHPRFGVLFTTLSGSIAWLTGISGIHTTQMASLLLLTLAAVVTAILARRLTASDAVAAWTFALALVSTDFLVDALDGLRESSTCLAFALLGLGAVTRHCLPFTLGLLTYTLTFSYGFAASAALLSVWCVWVICEGNGRKCLLPIGGWLLGVAVEVIMVHAYTGHWVPAPQLINVVGRWL